MFAWYPTYAPRRIAEILILSLTRVCALLGAGLSLVILAKLALTGHEITPVFVDWFHVH